jgi:CPA2 family monovalent cation:H+ antiporter-2
MVFALSSTAIVLQTLNEKGLTQSDGGRAGFSVLLFQDIAVIPMLALIPLLALPELLNVVHGTEAAHSGAGGEAGPAFIETLQAWQRGLLTAGAIAAVVVGGSFLTRPIFRYIAQTRLRELFTAAALMMVIGIALLMMIVGLSPALGTFLAGVVLANSEYRHELESDIEPFKGLLLGLFFITVGAAINFTLLSENLGIILAMTFGLMLLKALVLFGLAIAFKLRGSDRWLFSLGLAQAGEFGFVLISFTVANAVIPAALAEQMLLVVALSMLLTPLLFIVYDRVIAPRFSHAEAREADDIDQEADIIIAGVGRFGGVINNILLGAGHRTIVLDYNAEHLDMVRKFGIKVFYGDATRPDLLEAAGIAKAKMLIVAIDDREQSLELVRYVTEHYPHVYLITRAVDRHHVYELWAAGSRDIIRETFDSATRAGRSALEALGHHPYDAERQVRGYVRIDKKALRELAVLYDPDIPVHLNLPYIERSREFLAQQTAAMRGQGSTYSNRVERGWLPPTVQDLETVIEENLADDK